MSDLDVRALETNFVNWKNERLPDEPTGNAFERFAIEQVLKDADLSDQEIESGWFGGPDDGGADGLYLFINRTLMQDETEVPDKAVAVRLVIVQSAYEKSFGEGTIEKLQSFVSDLLDYSKAPDSFSYLNSEARDAIARFREKYDAVIASSHRLDVDLFYVTRATAQPNAKVVSRGNNLRSLVTSKLSAANVTMHYWSAAEVLRVVRTIPSQTRVLRIAQSFQTDDGSAVCLVRLADLAAFLTDEGTLRQSLFEANVRAYQGKRNTVNADIRRTLAEGTESEFWWLNNGVTILADSCSLSGNKLTVDVPSIVNGLQTSQEIYGYFESGPLPADARHVMVRVVIPPDDRTRNKIIKATNFQTPVSETSLYATEPIHFDIEDRLKLYGLFYDRRKGEYRNQRKPIDKIIGIKELAQAVMAILLRRPDDARARPMTVLDEPDTHQQVFGASLNRDVYVASIFCVRQVDDFLKARPELSRGDRRDLRYYMATVVACLATNKRRPLADDLAVAAPIFVQAISSAVLDRAFTVAQDVYTTLGRTDKIAKTKQMRDAVLAKVDGIV
jgi:hypothetical protein